jgi:hypothetical protein
VASESSLDLADWKKRSHEFGSVRYHAPTSSVVMEFAPAEHAATKEWLELRDRWLHLPRHPNLLEPVEGGDYFSLWLRYAALDWNYPPLSVHARDHARATLVAWGAQIIDMFATMFLEAGRLEPR